MRAEWMWRVVRVLAGRMCLLVAVAMVAATLGGAAVAAPNDVPVAPPLPFPVPPAPPYLDGFYHQAQARVAAAKPGEILAARQVNLANLWLIPLNVRAWQLAYRSTNTQGLPIAAIATVIVPDGPPPSGQRSLLSFQFAEDSLSQNCAPSYALQMGSLPNPLNQVMEYEFIEVQAMLQMGHAVVVPDHEGPTGAYGAGPLSARITLDGIRAAEDFAPAGLQGRATRVGLWGYSGGSIPTGHAAEMQPDYAPDVNLVGVADGGLLADVRATVDADNGGIATGAVLGALLGAVSEYPVATQFLDRHLNPLGQALRTIKSGQCVGVQGVVMPFLNIKGLVDYPGDPLKAPELQPVLDDLSLGKRVPHVPLFIYQSRNDEILPTDAVDALVHKYCRDPGARVAYTHDLLSEHAIAAFTGTASAALWLNDRLTGVPAAAGCSTREVLTQVTDPGAFPALVDHVGQTLASALGGPVGPR